MRGASYVIANAIMRLAGMGLLGFLCYVSFTRNLWWFTFLSGLGVFILGYGIDINITQEDEA